MYDNQVNQSVNQSISHICGAPTKAHFILLESIPIVQLFGIMEFDSLLISKHFKNKGSMKNCLLEMKAAAKLY